MGWKVDTVLTNRIQALQSVKRKEEYVEKWTSLAHLPLD